VVVVVVVVAATTTTTIKDYDVLQDIYSSKHDFLGGGRDGSLCVVQAACLAPKIPVIKFKEP